MREAVVWVQGSSRWGSHAYSVLTEAGSSPCVGLAHLAHLVLHGCLCLPMR